MYQRKMNCICTDYHIINIMWLFLCLGQDKAHSIHLLKMCLTALRGVDAGGGYIGVAQEIGQAGQVLFQAVVGPGKQVAEIVGEYLAGIHLGGCAQRLHVLPDI